MRAIGPGVQRHHAQRHVLPAQQPAVAAFIRMVGEILRFYRECGALLAEPGDGPTLGEYLREKRIFDPVHRRPPDPHGIGAVVLARRRRSWSFPAKYLVRFMANHRMLQVADRPEWRVVEGRLIELYHSDAERLERRGAAVTPRFGRFGRTRRDGNELKRRRRGTIRPCGAGLPQRPVAGLLTDATPEERSVLGAIRYQDNETVLHTDARILPRRRAAWAAWNAHIPQSDRAATAP